MEESLEGNPAPAGAILAMRALVWLLSLLVNEGIGSYFWMVFLALESHLEYMYFAKAENLGFQDE